jgi:hypothetical protein
MRRAAIVVLVAIGSASANAQEGKEYRGTQDQQMACTGDVFRLCWNEIPNVSRIVGCLEREKPQLTAACRAVFDQYSPRTSSSRGQRRHHRIASHQRQVATDGTAEIAELDLGRPQFETGFVRSRFRARGSVRRHRSSEPARRTRLFGHWQPCQSGTRQQEPCAKIPVRPRCFDCESACRQRLLYMLEF